MASSSRSQKVIHSELVANFDNEETNPCFAESQISKKCLSDNNYDYDKCEREFENFKACKKFWHSVVQDRRKKGLKPDLPPLSERRALKEEYLLKLQKQVERFVSTSLSSFFNKLNVHPSESYKPAIGLFGYEELESPSGFYILRENAIISSMGLVNKALSPQRDQKMVQIFDQLSNCLCKVADMAEFVRVGHPNPKYRIAAEECSIAISAEVEKLNTNRQLYDSLVNVVKNKDKFPTDPIDDHVAKLFLFDFEQSGIHLDSKTRETVVGLNESILYMSSYFMNNSHSPRVVPRSSLPEEIRHFFHVEGDNVVVNNLYSNSENEIVREAAYRIYLHPDDHQNKLLTDLLFARKYLANLCGFKSYAERAIRGGIADTPENVGDFLETLAGQLRPLAEKDFDRILDLKKKLKPFAKCVQSWDIPFYIALIKETQFSKYLSSCSPYFSLGACMDGLNMIFNKLFGVELVVCNDSSSSEVWFSNVIKIAVYAEETKTLLGYIYCDFFERQSKPHQDCHFTIQATKTHPTLLSPHMVDNLFHEMGHAMHSMLARTPYQHITGTRCSTDLAEVPSILMEYFASDPRVMRNIARHYRTGEQIPEILLQSWIESKKICVASETSLQVFYSILDQVYHSENPLMDKKNTTEVLSAIQNKYYGIPHVPNTAWQLRFGHLVGYGAKYYAYLVSRAVARLIWEKLFAQDPLSKEAGEIYRREVLSHGGGKHPKDIVESVLQETVTSQSLAGALLDDVLKTSSFDK
ncbi:mitochondrial intermediate peptidase-like protein [Leptotrombidium deliense]|uniref:Mitochondrial intermediate peptidase-like protein n=1 Tax=Leptotrombidium deliense TaxID=299467 RepID=A0A443S544_9ACAR|nr:mitochondrial intermediate peptidase-like protein [Leptotrombidium deliense]